MSLVGKSLYLSSTRLLFFFFIKNLSAVSEMQRSKPTGFGGQRPNYNNKKMELFRRKRFVIISISKRKMLKMIINSAYAVLETLKYFSTRASKNSTTVPVVRVRTTFRHDLSLTRYKHQCRGIICQLATLKLHIVYKDDFLMTLIYVNVYVGNCIYSFV